MALTTIFDIFNTHPFAKEPAHMSSTIHPIDPSTVPVDAHTSAHYRDVLAQIVAFRDSKGWAEYHTLPNLAKSLSIEASEVLEIFQWLDTGDQLGKDEQAHLTEELADVLTYTFFMCDRLGVDPLKLVAAKNAINRGRHWAQTEND
jgi:NTP pyrophosphatase (non-canonical NTP hydrolase)